MLWGMRRCLERLGALPEKLVWDREGAIHAGGGRPTDAFAGVLRPARRRLGDPRAAADPQAKGVAGALARLHALELRAGPAVRERARLPAPARRLVRQGQPRVHRNRRAPSRSSGLREERERMRPLPARLPDLDRRLGDPGAAAALPALRPQRLLARPRLRRPPRRAARLQSRGDRGRARHRRARLPATGACSPAPHVHRPRAPARARAAARPAPRPRRRGRDPAAGPLRRS